MPDPYRVIGWAWAAIGILWLAASVTSKPTVRRQPLGSRLTYLSLGVIAGFLIAGKGWWRNVLGWQLVPRSPGTADVGMILTLAGIIFDLWARFVLGRNWSGTVTVKQDHELVQSGPYGVVRHPIYSGFLLALAGTVIAQGDVGAFLGLVLATLALRLKSLTEEAFMTQQFGSQYTTYKRTVKALIPFVW